MSDVIETKVEETKEAEPVAEKAPRKKSGKRGFFSHLFWILVLAAILFLAYKLYPYVFDVMGFAQEDKAISFEISPEDTNETISQGLRQEGIVLSARAFRNFVSKSDSKNIEYVPGFYSLNKNMSFKELVKTLSSAPAIDRSVVKVTFPEGYTVVDMAKLLQENGICTAADFIKSQNEDEFDYDFVKALQNVEKRGYRLEGYLFPATYDFQKNSEAKDIVKTMLSAFDDRYTSDIKNRLKELNITLDEAVTLASIVQKEAYGEDSIKNIASVFWNRLKSDDYPCLQSNPSTAYAETLGAVKMKYYDTYECTGLPVGAICNPGLNMIEGVLYPNDTDYFYFVSDSNQNFHYASSFYEHQQNCYAAGLY